MMTKIPNQGTLWD